MEIIQYMYLTGGILGCVSILKLFNLKKNVKIINNYFIALIAILTIRQFNCLMESNINEEFFINEYSTSIFNFTLFITLYLLVNSLVGPTKENKYSYTKYIIVLALLYLTVNAILIVTNNHINIYKLLIDFIFTAGICYINLKLIRHFYLNGKSNLNFILITANLQIILILLSFFIPLKNLLQIINFILDENSVLIYKYQPLTSVITIIIFVYLLINISTIINKLENENRTENEITDFIAEIDLIWKYKIADAKLNPAEIEVKKRISTKIENYINKINTLDLENNILLKKGATMNDLAIDLKIPKSHMAFIFKYNCKINFVSFKNRIRIENSKKLIKNNYLETNTLNSLAEKIGFKSYDPFFKSFKEITGKGPMEYNIANKNSRGKNG